MKIDNITKKRFLSKINKTSSCWLWLACKHNFGYGCFKFNKKQITAHRFSWMLYKGEIPKGLYILHKCDIPECCNPKHLFLGTQKDNLIDCSKKNRTAIGEKNGNSRLKTKKIINIRLEYSKGNITHRKLGKQFNVDKSVISDILNRKTWKHVH